MNYKIKQLSDLLSYLSEEADKLKLPLKERTELERAIIVILTHILIYYTDGGIDNEQN